MIHDAFVEVTCDGDKCSSTENVGLDFVYPDYTGKSGHYDDSKVEEKLIADYEWIVVEDDDDDALNKHYCCDDCVG